MSWFGSRLPIDDDELEFQLATFKWLLREFGEPAPRLIAPTPEFFPSIKPGQHTPAERIFEDVRRAAQMEEWQCELRVGDTNVPIDAGDAMLVHEGSHAPCGTFQIVEGPNGNQVVITYDPDMELDQQALVATFAHELGHYLLATARARRREAGTF